MELIPPGRAVALVTIAVASALLLAGSGSRDADSSSPSASTVVASGAAPEVGTSGEPPAAEERDTSGVDLEQYAGGDPSVAYGFVTPSGKWLCAITPANGMVACASHTPGTPPGVPGPLQIPVQAPGPSAEANIVAIEAAKGPSFQTANQPLFPGNPNVLPYGSTLSADGFTCNVQFSGVSCREDATNQGFTISTGGYKFEFTPIPGTPDGAPPQLTPTEPTAPPLPQLEGGSNQCGRVVYPSTGEPATVVIVKGTIRCDAAHAMLNRYFTAPDATDAVYDVNGWKCRTKGDPHSAATGYSITCTDSGGNIVVAQP
jgi:hypothetical protein